MTDPVVQYFIKEGSGVATADAGTLPALNATITTGAGSWNGATPHKGYNVNASAFIRTTTWAGAGNKVYDSVQGALVTTWTIVVDPVSAPGIERVVFGISNTDGGIIFQIWLGTDLSIYMDSAVAAGVANMNATPPLSAGSRSVVTYQYDSAQADETLRQQFWVNGVLVATNPLGNTITQNLPININSFAFDQLLCIGARGDNNRLFPGIITYCDIVAEALSSAQIMATHAALAANDDQTPYGQPASVIGWDLMGAFS